MVLLLAGITCPKCDGFEIFPFAVDEDANAEPPNWYTCCPANYLDAFERQKKGGSKASSSKFRSKFLTKLRWHMEAAHKADMDEVRISAALWTMLD